MATNKKGSKSVSTKKVRKSKQDAKDLVLGIVAKDSYLKPFNDAIKGRHEHVLWKISQLTQNGSQTLSDFANGYQYFGLHRTVSGWVFREWAPNATEIYLIGDFNGWKE